MRVAFFGNPEYCLPSLQALIDSKDIEPVLVVTGPDKVRGRRGKRTPSPVKELALEAGIPVITPEKVNNSEVVDEISSYKPDILVVIAYGQLIGKRLRDQYGEYIINLHGSLLPKYRGAAPIQRALLNGDKITGVTSMLIKKELDAGEMLAKREVKIKDDDDLNSLMEKLSRISSELMIYTLNNYETLLENKEIQDSDLATYAPKVEKSEAWLDFNSSAELLVRKVKTFSEWPGAKFKYDNKIFKIKEAYAERIGDIDSNRSDKIGQIISASDDGIKIATGDGIIVITQIQAEGKKSMPVKDFLNGNEIKIGKFVS